TPKMKTAIHLAAQIAFGSSRRHMADHRVDHAIGVFRGDRNSRMAARKNAEHFIGEALTHGFYVSEIKHDVAELLEIREQSFRFRAGDELALNQFHEHLRLLKLEVVFLGREAAEDVFKPVPAAALDCEGCL